MLLQAVAASKQTEPEVWIASSLPGSFITKEGEEHLYFAFNLCLQQARHCMAILGSPVEQESPGNCSRQAVGGGCIGITCKSDCNATWTTFIVKPVWDANFDTRTMAADMVL